MPVQRIDHIGINVEDLEAAIAFFVQLGFELQHEGSVEGDWVDRIVGLEGVRSELAFLQAPDGHGRLELIRFRSPPSPRGDDRAPSNAPGLRHLCFAVDDLGATLAGLRERGVELLGSVERFEDQYELCYVRGPEGIIVELAEKLGSPEPG